MTPKPPKSSRKRPKVKAGTWQPIETAPTTGRVRIVLKVPGRCNLLAHSDTWWIGGFSVECKPTHWKPFVHPKTL